MSNGKKIYNRDLVVNGSVTADTLKADALEVADKALSHVVVFAGQHTTAGGAVAEDITLGGVLATDLAFAVLVSNGTSGALLQKVEADDGKISLEFSANPLAGSVVSYQVLRAV